MQLSPHPDPNIRLLEFIDAVNAQFKVALSPGNTVCLDESMVKSFHKRLCGKMKIKRKPRPIGNGFKTMSSRRPKNILHMEMYEGKEYMKHKKHLHELGATAETLKGSE